MSGLRRGDRARVGAIPERRHLARRRPALAVLFACSVLCSLGLWPGVGALPAYADRPSIGPSGDDLGQTLFVRGMTFVASEGSTNEILLKAELARFYPNHQIADLERVDLEVAGGDGRTGFTMTCDEGRLDLESQDFIADGNVVGTIEGGRQFTASWVAYDEVKGILYTDDPVLIEDEGGRYRGGGFRYLVEEERFKLLGGATVVQDP